MSDDHGHGGGHDDHGGGGHAPAAKKHAKNDVKHSNALGVFVVGLVIFIAILKLIALIDVSMFVMVGIGILLFVLLLKPIGWVIFGISLLLWEGVKILFHLVWDEA